MQQAGTSSDNEIKNTFLHLAEEYSRIEQNRVVGNDSTCKYLIIYLGGGGIGGEGKNTSEWADVVEDYKLCFHPGPMWALQSQAGMFCNLFYRRR